MRRALFILALIIGMMGVMVLPIQAHDGSDDGDDSRNESSENHDDDDGEDQELHGRSLLPGGVADERRPRPRACPAPYT